LIAILFFRLFVWVPEALYHNKTTTGKERGRGWGLLVAET